VRARSFGVCEAVFERSASQVTRTIARAAVLAVSGSGWVDVAAGGCGAEPGRECP
jgi:hypothetical protein